MKKSIVAIITGTLFFFCMLPLSAGAAQEGDDSAAATTSAASNEAEKAAYTASMSGINQTIIEGAIFGTALALMAIGISSGSDAAHGQAHGHGH